MKKIVFLFSLIIMCAVAANAQYTTPRFGTLPNDDNTGRVLTYKYLTLTDATGTDSVAIYPNAWQTNYRIALTDSLTIKNPTITKSYAGDNMRFIVTGTSGAKLKFYGANFVTQGKVTLSTSGVAIVELLFNGTKWVECGRNVQ